MNGHPMHKARAALALHPRCAGHCRTTGCPGWNRRLNGAVHLPLAVARELPALDEGPHAMPALKVWETQAKTELYVLNIM